MVYDVYYAAFPFVAEEDTSLSVCALGVALLLGDGRYPRGRPLDRAILIPLEFACFEWLGYASISVWCVEDLTDRFARAIDVLFSNRLLNVLNRPRSRFIVLVRYCCFELGQLLRKSREYRMQRATRVLLN